ncbi:MAG: thioredoxin domain-containing protein [Candidatus Peribacteraceae bacterium]|nr:thioredoxin domain-containing protein [Candidatus Peribacteraceae bacterium]
MESEDSSKRWLLLALALVILIGGYLFVQWLRGGEEVLLPSAPELPVPLMAPAIQPKITKFSEIAQYTEGKPLPDKPPTGVSLSFIEDDEHLRGDPKTKVAMVEYVGLSSLYAQLTHPELIDFLEQNKDKMHWVFRHYPSTDNANDYRAGQATECVTQQLGNDGFWKYLDLLMADAPAKLDLASLVAKGGEVGADAATLQKCIENEELYDYVMLDKKNAQYYSKIHVTPAFVFMNRITGTTRIVDGVNSMEYMQEVLNRVYRGEVPEEDTSVGPSGV